jgi:4-hydroxybenzoate polyprenyltransferase
MNRWWIYQKERFPIFAHGTLIAAFSACAVAYSSMLGNAASPTWQIYATAFVVCFLMFLQLRIADEFKDKEEDARWRPYRPVPRGLVKLSDLRMLFIIAAVIQAAVAIWLEPKLFWVLAIAWSYLALMSVEFFCRDWLKARPVIYLVSHMGIMPLVDYFGTACEWVPRGSDTPSGIAWFLAASFFNGIVIEFGRKIRLPADEEEGVDTYSQLWGMKRAAVLWIIAMIATMVCGTIAASRIGFTIPLASVLGVLLLISCVLAFRFAQQKIHGKKIEAITGVWTLALYLTLGLIPLFLNR